MNELLLENLETRATRRRIVTTGAKLAYAAPLVALSFKVSARGASAITPVGCFHSLGGDTGEGCKGACVTTGCSGGACNGFGDDPENDPDPCDACNLRDNACPSDDYCNPDCFTCDTATDTATFVC